MFAVTQIQIFHWYILRSISEVNASIGLSHCEVRRSTSAQAPFDMDEMADNARTIDSLNAVGKNDDVHDMRDEYGADLVIFVDSFPEGCAGG